jgi:hypothetical protein
MGVAEVMKDLAVLAEGNACLWPKSLQVSHQKHAFSLQYPHGQVS